VSFTEPEVRQIVFFLYFLIVFIFSTMKSFAALLLFVLAFTAAACYLHPHVPGRRTSDLDQQQIFQSLSDFFGELSIEAGAAAPGGRR
jgi:hypothetical protein